MTLNELAQQINDNARAKGFWDADRNMGEMLMLAVSELAEALEEHRAGKPAEYVCTGACKPEGVAVELADAVIRIADLCGHLGIDLEEVIEIKMAYNEGRPYKHGKKF